MATGDSRVRNLRWCSGVLRVYTAWLEQELEAQPRLRYFTAEGDGGDEAPRIGLERQT